MCYYIGIENLAGNAMIEILEKQGEIECTQESLTVSYEALEAYGAEAVRYINCETEEKALLILSGASTAFMFRNYSDVFVELEDESGIKLKEGKTVDDLKERFRSYEAIDLINAFVADATVRVLYERCFGRRLQEI